MNVISKSQSAQPIATGRMSDGSDRLENFVITHTIIVDENGRTLRIAFDHNPTDAEIVDKITANAYEDVTTVEDQIAQLKADNLTLMDAMATIYEALLAKGAV